MMAFNDHVMELTLLDVGDSITRKEPVICCGVQTRARAPAVVGPWGYELMGSPRSHVHKLLHWIKYYAVKGSGVALVCAQW
jgi:hypothetical protein